MKDENISNDLEKLVSMAEKTSETVNDLRTKITNLKVMLFMLAISAYIFVGFTSLLISKPHWFDGMNVSMGVGFVFSTAALFLGVIFFSFQYFRKIKKYRKALKAEVVILHKLLVMVDEYRSYLKKGDGFFVDEVIVDMRLQRIKYSGKW